jgi:hypothetical protein
MYISCVIISDNKVYDENIHYFKSYGLFFLLIPQLTTYYITQICANCYIFHSMFKLYTAFSSNQATTFRSRVSSI